MSTLDRKLDRLAARGYFEISPTSIVVREFTDVGEDGKSLTTVKEWGPGFQITWAPPGQGSASGGRYRFNPFCTRSVARRTIEEAVDVLLEATAPTSRWDLDDLVSERVWKRKVGDLVGRLLVGQV